MTKETRIQRATRIVHLMQLEDSGQWAPCDDQGNPRDQEEAEYVKHTVTGKVYKWNQTKRIEEYEQSLGKNTETHTPNGDMVELNQLIDRMYEILDRMEKLHQKAS